MSRRGNVFSGLALVALVGLVACEIPNPGIDPTPSTLNFPIAIALSAAPNPGDRAHFLLVVSSNYDVRYNQGSILSLDMDAIQARFDDIAMNGRRPPADDPDHLHPRCSNPAAWDSPTIECQIGEASGLLAGDPTTHERAEVWIDSFASGLVLSPQGDRFYLPVRSRANLTWIDIDPDGSISCEQALGSRRCGDRRRTTIASPAACSDLRDVTLHGDPNAVVATTLDRFSGRPEDATRDLLILVMRNGTTALFVDDQQAGTARQPIRTHVLTGMPFDAINAQFEPSTGLTWIDTSSPVSTRATRVLPRVGVHFDAAAPECSAVFAAPSVVLDGIATGFDSRDVAWSDDGRFAYVLSRLPESILTIDQHGTPFLPGDASIVDVDDVGFGPSRLRHATIGGEEMLVATCFDGRAVWVMRTEPTELASIVPGFDGAYEMVIDEQRGWAIVADFKTSVIRFVDLNPVAHGHPAVLLGRIGTPRTHVGFP